MNDLLNPENVEVVDAPKVAKPGFGDFKAAQPVEGEVNFVQEDDSEDKPVVLH